MCAREKARERAVAPRARHETKNHRLTVPSSVPRAGVPRGEKSDKVPKPISLATPSKQTLSQQAPPSLTSFGSSLPQRQCGENNFEPPQADRPPTAAPPDAAFSSHHSTTHHTENTKAHQIERYKRGSEGAGVGVREISGGGSGGRERENGGTWIKTRWVCLICMRVEVSENKHAWFNYYYCVAPRVQPNDPTSSAQQYIRQCFCAACISLPAYLQINP